MKNGVSRLLRGLSVFRCIPSPSEIWKGAAETQPVCVAMPARVKHLRAPSFDPALIELQLREAGVNWMKHDEAITAFSSRSCNFFRLN